MEFEERLKEIYSEPELPGEISDKYSVESCLKHTDDRQVYLIKSKSDNNAYILKCAHSEYAALIQKEYELLKKAESLIRCPKPIDCITIENKSYLIKEYIKGEALNNLVEKRTFTDREITEIISVLCDDIIKLHSHNPAIILRDIKPENIIASDGNYIFVDFDASREYNSTASSDTEYVGTRATAAPEQFGYSQTDVRTDVYAIGMLMLYMKTGKFDRDFSVSSKLDRIIRKCIAFSPAERYDSVSKLKSALSETKKPLIFGISAAAALIVITSVIIIVSSNSVQKNPNLSSENTTTSTAESISVSESEITEPIIPEAGSLPSEKMPITAKAKIDYSHKDSSSEKQIHLLDDGNYDFSEILTVKCKITALNNSCNAMLMSADSEGNNFSGDTIEIDEKSRLLVMNTNGNMDTIPFINITELNEGTEIIISDIEFLSETYNGNDCWISGNDGSYTFTSDLNSNPLKLTPYMRASQIEYILADFNVDGYVKTSVGGWTNDGNLSCSETVKELTDYSGTIKFELGNNVSDGRLADKDVQFVLDDISKGTTVKISNIRYYGNADNNVFTYTEQAESYSDKMVSEALSLIENQNHMNLPSGINESDMIKFMLTDSDYAVFGGKEWPASSTSDERFFIAEVTDEALTPIYRSNLIKLDTVSSASMSTGWFISGVVYSQNISLNSYRVYVDGEAGNYKLDELRDYFKHHFQAGEHLRIDETRSMSFVSCSDEGFYFIEYGSENNSDHNLRLRYYSFEDFTAYLNGLNKQMWYYEVNENLN